MGKAKRGDAEDAYFPVDIKSVLIMKPEQRVKWLAKACRHANDGNASVKQLYDVLSSRKIAQDMTEKVGTRMLRTLRDHLWIFSEKQQRFLGEESVLARQFGADKAPAAAASDDEAKELATAASGRSSQSEDAATRMEEMMARCRDFVREKAGTYEERQKAVEDAERHAQESRRREKLQKDWDVIAKWHLPLEPTEQAQMFEQDERGQELEKQRLAEEQAREAARPAPRSRDRSSKEKRAKGGLSPSEAAPSKHQSRDRTSRSRRKKGGRSPSEAAKPKKQSRDRSRSRRAKGGRSPSEAGKPKRQHRDRSSKSKKAKGGRSPSSSSSSSSPSRRRRSSAKKQRKR